jgi:filamin
MFYTLSFTILREGKYNLIITYANNLLPNMPIQLIASSINVLSKNNSASQVICSGEGLQMGIVGKEMKCLINTRNAAPGELTAYCQGIHKSALCRLFDHRDGIFTLFIKPEESGKHLLTIKYNGENVPGSPYTVRVSGPPDAREY